MEQLDNVIPKMIDIIKPEAMMESLIRFCGHNKLIMSEGQPKHYGMGSHSVRTPPLS